MQFSPQTRIAVRGQYYDQVYFDGAAPSFTRRARIGRENTAASSSARSPRSSAIRRSTRSREARRTDSARDSLVEWNGGCFPNQPVGCTGFPSIFLRGYSIQSPGNMHNFEHRFSIRDDFVRTATRGGRQVLKLGGEYLRLFSGQHWCAFCIADDLCAELAHSGQYRGTPPSLERRVHLEPGAAVPDRHAEPANQFPERIFITTCPSTSMPAGRRMTGRLHHA